MKTWKHLPGYPGYSISSEGDLRNDRTGTILKSRPVKNYMQVGVYKNGKKKEVKIHRAVASAFIGPPPSPKHQVAHNDNGKRDRS